MKRGTFCLVIFMFIMAGCAGDDEDFKKAAAEKLAIELPAIPQKNKPTLYPVLDSRLDKYGFKNSENKWMINPVYENVGLIQLKDGFYLVKKVEKGVAQFIFLDKYGDNVIGRTFQDAREFAAGIALVLADNRSEIINHAGAVVDKVGEQDDPAFNKNMMLDGRLFIATGKVNIEDEKGKTRIRDIWTGKTLYEGTFHYARNVDGRYAVVNDVLNKTTYLYGYNGKMKAIKDYYVLRPGLDEMIMAPYTRKDPYAGDLYVYNLKKNEISPFPTWKTYGDKAVLEKILEFKDNKKLYVYMINSDTNILLLYKEPMQKDKKEDRFGSVLGEYAEGLAPIEIDFRGSHYIFIDEDGQYVLGSPINGHLKNAFEFVDGYALVQLGAHKEGSYYNDKWCYVDKKGHIKIREDIGYIQEESGQWFLE